LENTMTNGPTEHAEALDRLPATMTAVRFDLDSSTLGLHEVPVPEPGHGEVLIQVRAAGVCLSDVHVIDGSLRGFKTRDNQRIITMGHEVAGTIVRIGPGVPAIWQAGGRVCLWAGDRCGRCARCLYDTGWCLAPVTRGVNFDGGWAQYAVTHHRALVPVPGNIPFEQAAIIPDAVSTPYQGLMRQGALRPGDSVGIWGAGGLGYHAILIARLVGAAPIIAIDPLPAARERALIAGADHAFDPDEIDFVKKVRTATGGAGLNVAVDFVGIPSVRSSADDLLAAHGRLVLVGMSPHSIELARGERFNILQHQVLGNWGSEPDDLHRLVRLCALGRLNMAGSVSELLPLTEAASAVERLQKKIGNPVRIVLTP
jgi:D-arabinose 1-dehydrogenase-like Zn-dependent alcohol dehydrogenase